MELTTKELKTLQAAIIRMPHLTGKEEIELRNIYDKLETEIRKRENHGHRTKKNP